MNTIIIFILVKLAIFLVLLFLTMFFTASETALTALRRTQIKRLIKEKGCKGLSAWLKNPNSLLASTLIGINLSVIGVTVIGTTIALDLSGLFGIAPALALTVSTIIIMVLVLIFADITPKAYARRNAQKVAVKIINPLRVVVFLFSPVVWIFTFGANLVIKIFGGKSLKEQPLFAFEEIKGLIALGAKEGVIASVEEKMLSQIMEFGSTVVREVMLPRVDMKMLDINIGEKKLVKDAMELRHSRIPVYRENHDNIIGILYVKDLLHYLAYLAGGEDIDVEKILRQPYFVPETMSVGVLLRKFRIGREHIAVVVDEYGVTAGLITIEDIVEEITGEIFDEYDIKETRIIKIDDKNWEIDAIEDHNCHKWIKFV